MTIHPFVRLVAIIGALPFVASLAACNTMEGFGKDLKRSGTALENAAQKNAGQKTAAKPPQQ